LRSVLTPAEPDAAPAPQAGNGRVRRPSHKWRPHRRRRVLIALGLLVALFAGLGGGGAFAYTTVKSKAAQLQAQLTVHLQAGQADLEAAKASLKQANANHDVKLVDQSKSQFLAAKAEFTLTRHTADNSNLLRQLEGLPDVGKQARADHAAVNGVADMGAAISDAGIELCALAAEIIAPPKGAQAGRTLLTVLTQANASLVKVRADLQRAQNAVAGVDVSVIPAGQQATLLKAEATIDGALAGMDEFQKFVPIITEVLGGNGPRNYLVEQVNPAELRPGGGFIGTYSVLRADNGTLKLIQSGDAYDLANPRPRQGEPGYVAPPGPFRALVGFTSWSFVDSNFFADFPGNAKYAELFVQGRLGTQIDAVISMDYYTVAALLQLTGPLRVPGYATTVTASNFIPLVVANSLTQDAINKPILKAIAGPLMQQISALPPERWPSLLGILNGLATARHLQVYFNSQSVEDELGQFGWSGELHAGSSFDFMSEVEANLGATKANYFVTRHYSVVLTKRGNLLHHDVFVDLINDTPYMYRPNDYYKAYIRLFVSTNATGAQDNLSQGRYGNPNPPSGTVQLTGWTLMPGYGNRYRAHFEYDTPWLAIWQGKHFIYWQKQPGTTNDAVNVTWNDGGGHSYTAASALNQDLIMTLAPDRVTLTPAQPAAATLPSLSLG
jgi:uncharacterized protein DUF4012